MGATRVAAEADAFTPGEAGDGEPLAGGDDRAGAVGASAPGGGADDDAGQGGAGGGGISAGGWGSLNDRGSRQFPMAVLADILGVYGAALELWTRPNNHSDDRHVDASLETGRCLIVAIGHADADARTDWSGFLVAMSRGQLPTLESSKRAAGSFRLPRAEAGLYAG